MALVLQSAKAAALSLPVKTMPLCALWIAFQRFGHFSGRMVLGVQGLEFLFPLLFPMVAVLLRRVGKGMIDQVLGFWGKMETIALELVVANSFMKGKIKELESTNRKTYAEVVGCARSGQDSKEVPRRKETYSVMVQSKLPKEDGDKIREKVNKIAVDVRVEKVRRNRSGGQ